MTIQPITATVIITVKKIPFFPVRINPIKAKAKRILVEILCLSEEHHSTRSNPIKIAKKNAFVPVCPDTPA